ncbi:chorismate mutase family protein [Rhodococcus spongiicola]|uniref:Chorismate mutase family protein n=1 Tax=Rhodococcus spongiicola TaxID=2487352 RepID=A0A438AX48_9NOCA|nr:chorismate mutase family protein [Rhodococcus spongiicola]RVW03268.1 chorismate mutase family protein [Rhodococcus spongiicola]
MDDTKDPTRADSSGLAAETDPADQPSLARLRSELDAIDARLLEDIRDRIDVCVRIAECKRRQRIPMMQPQRVGLVHARAEQYARDNGLSAEFLRELYNVVIAETCRIEDVVIGSNGDPSRTPG